MRIDMEKELKALLIFLITLFVAYYSIMYVCGGLNE